MKPKLSIVTICFNNSHGLEKTLESCKQISQHINFDLEHIIVDSSPESHRGVLEKFSSAPLKHIVTEPLGIYSALNTGTNAVSGSFVWHLHAGDRLYDANSLGLALKKLENAPAAEVLFSPIYRNLSDGTITRPPDFKNQRLNFIFSFGPIHSGTIFRKSIFDKVGGYDESYKIAADVEFFARLENMKASYIYHPTPFSLFDNSGVSQTQHNLSMNEFNRAMQILKTNPVERLIIQTRIAYHQFRLNQLRRFLKSIGCYEFIHRSIESLKTLVLKKK